MALELQGGRPRTSITMRTWLSYLYGYTLAPHEAATARHGFSAFAFLLSSYFILLPLREDVALTLGPELLPRLFTASLVVTAIVAPLVSAYILNPTTGSRATGFRRLCWGMAGCLIGLFGLLLATSNDPGAAARLLAALRPGTAAAVERGSGPGPPLSWYGNAARVCFYVYLSLQSLLSTSALWAVCADTFSAATSTKVYGFLGAGATLGQLTSSLAALAFGAAGKRSGAAGAAALWLLLPAAGLLLMSARACQAMSDLAEQHPGLLGPADRRASSEDGQSSDAHANSRSMHRQHSTGGGAVYGSGGGAAGGGGAAHSPRGAQARWFGRRWWQRLRRSAAASHAPRLLEGFRLIAASPYLLLACAFLAINYAVSATIYFLRASVVSRSLADSSSRIAFFAALNTASAGLIFVTQVLVTGRVLTRLGVGATLVVGPAVSLAGMALICARPSAATIAGVEVVRKVAQYALARPCREALFTLVSRREKYVAKVVLDTVVQRLGDTAAAALFEVIGVQMALGSSAVAVAGIGLCAAHVAVAAALGRMYGNRKAAAAAAAKHALHDL